MNSYVYRIIRKIKILLQKWFIEFHYKHQTGRTLNLKDPKEFNGKIQWLKIYYKPIILTQLVDKYDVRSFVAEKAGAQYLNDIFGVYDNAAVIDFDVLPKRFVLKATHGYDMNLIVQNKEEMNADKIRCIATQWLSINHYYHAGKDWAYKNIKPRLITEKFLEEKGRKSINDYKFFCFNGEPKFLNVDLDRNNNHCVCYYDMEWNKLPFVKKGKTPSKETIAKPENFEEMVEVVRKLAVGFPFVRVDLYNINGKIVFGEMTFYPADGRTEFEPEEYNRIMGDYIQLPKIPKGGKAITHFSANGGCENFGLKKDYS